MNETGYLYSIHKGKFEEEQDIYVKFDKIPMDHGTFRDCYLGKIYDEKGNQVVNEEFPNGYCVVKIPKKGFYNYKLDFICSEFANKLAIKYNNEVAKIPDKINFILPYGAKLDKFKGKNIANNIVSVEPYLDGEYIKFYNNDGAPFEKYLLLHFVITLGK